MERRTDGGREGCVRNLPRENGGAVRKGERETRWWRSEVRIEERERGGGNENVATIVSVFFFFFLVPFRVSE